MSTAMIWQTVSTSSADTEKLGELLGKLVQPKMVIELRSDLGGGKTTFVRGLAKGLGVSGQISSPSFTLSQEHQARSGTKLYHFDFYRLAESGVLADQLMEVIADPKGVVVVEWSDIVQDVLPEQRLTIEFKPLGTNENEREININYPEPLAGTIQTLESEWQGIKA